MVILLSAARAKKKWGGWRVEERERKQNLRKHEGKAMPTALDNTPLCKDKPKRVKGKGEGKRTSLMESFAPE